ncbi:MAG TPA: glycoside hydrolase family 13 protein [Puia sp.]|nr:glycoside hydrolase family 13 protein [Puia sp.]
MRSFIAIGLALCMSLCVCAQGPARCYPTNWWVGMKDPNLQLMIRDTSWAAAPAITISYPGVQLVKVQPAANPHYVFLDLRIGKEARPGTMKIRVKTAGGVSVIDYALQTRRTGNGSRFAQGVTSSDFIYFLMPDRWSNGDPDNDRVPGMRDQSLNRDSIFLRHGGDMQGILDHLDYLQGLGVTTLWMTPVLVNDMPNRTEHGYAFTDHYTIDPRLGGATLYKKLSDELHRRGMKLIQDAVYNHVGLYHFLVQDAPSRSWLHRWPEFTQTSYRDQPLMDPHASATDKKITSDGWFTREMPDINQGDPYVANFLIQHAIWCVETFGVDGWRIDTYIYNDLAFMNRCNKALMDEYPRITLFGEAWVHGVSNQAFFVENNLVNAYKSNLQGAVDFQCNFYGILPALTEKPGWTDGVMKLYNTLSNDFLYKDPSRNVIFLDNHDMSRWFSQVGEDVRKQKVGIEWLLTCRGIPQLYYGTEVLMKGFANPDGWVRLDFPGGWKGDKKNAFTGEGLSGDEKSVQELVRTLANFRKGSSALKTGKMMQYVPSHGLYVYFRWDAKQTVLCAMNTDSLPAPLDIERYHERTAGFSQAIDVTTGKHYPLREIPAIPAGEMWILELKKS